LGEKLRSLISPGDWGIVKWQHRVFSGGPIYSSNNEEEARKIDFLLSQNGYESKFTIKSSDTLFGINAFSGDTELLMGTFSVYCDSAVIDEAFALLENVVSHGEHDSIQQSSPAEYKEELDQTEPKIPIEVKLNFSKAILFSFFPFMGFGTITAVRYATKIPEEYGWRKMVALGICQHRFRVL
jgi:hypothetical protein